MSNRCFFPPLVLFLLMLACASSAVAQSAARWQKYSSENFDLISCTSARESKRMLVELEQFRQFFFKAIPQGRIYDPKPLIFVFDSDRQFNRYSAKPQGTKGKPSQPVGTFMRGPLQSRIIMVNRRIDQGLGTIFHEYVHSLVYTRMGSGVPLWLNEGLACVYQTFHVAGDTVTFGRVSGNRMHAFRHSPMIPSGTLFTVDHKSKYYNESDQVNIFYAQSWLLLHYAMLGEKNEPYTVKNLMRFADETSRRKTDMEATFKKIFGSDYKTLERKLRNYLSSGKYTQMTTKIPAASILEKITTAPLGEEEREIELAGLRWRSLKDRGAEATLYELMGKHPANPRVHEILYEIKSGQREADLAKVHLRQAIEKGTANPMVYLALLKHHRLETSLRTDRMLFFDVADECTALVDRALELAPDCMDAYELLAMIEAQKADIRVQKIDDVLEALPFMRVRDKTWLALATIYWRQKQYDKAEAAIDAVANDPKASHSTQQRARELLRRIAKETGKEIPPPLPERTQQGKSSKSSKPSAKSPSGS